MVTVTTIVTLTVKVTVTITVIRICFFFSPERSRNDQKILVTMRERLGTKKLLYFFGIKQLFDEEKILPTKSNFVLTFYSNIICPLCAHILLSITILYLL